MSDTATVEQTPTGTDVLGSMSAEARAHWRLTGELPGTPAEARDREPETSGESSDVSLESSPSQPAEQVAETAAQPPPASEPGTLKKKSNAETRKAELNAEILALKAQRDALRSEVSSVQRPQALDVKPAESLPAAPQTLAQVIASPDVSQPLMEEDGFFAAYPDAKVADYIRYVSRYEVAEVQRQADQTSRQQAARERFAGRLASMDADVMGRLPDEITSATPLDLLAPTAKPSVWDCAVQEILESPHAAALLAHLADHPDAVRTISRARTGAETIRAVLRLEASLAPSSVPSQPVVKTTTSAPAPPQTLGTRPSVPADPAKAAVAAGDFAAYASAMNAKERQR